MKYILALVTLLFGVSFSLSWNDEITTRQFQQMNLKKAFGEWKEFFGKNYTTLIKEAYRYELWRSAMEKIAAENSKDLTYKLRMNQFGDLTDDEFKIAIHGHKGSCLRSPPLEDDVKPTDDFNGFSDNPASVDWEAKGVVTPVKNQGQCGSCWAFATTGSIECDYAIAKGTLNSLSEQQLVDCSGSYGNYGCDGGWWYDAYDYVVAEGGLCSETEYPYTARDGTCKSKTCGTLYDPIKGGDKITPDNGAALETAAAQGCVAVGVEADQTSFQYYSSGVLTGNCGTNIDHGVLVVGYGKSGTQDYWKVKNSWGESWGDKGYIYICKDCDKNGERGECGINMYPYLVNV